MNLLDKKDLFTEKTLNSFPPHFEASAADIFWKHWDKRRNCLKRAIYPIATMFSTYFSSYTCILRAFPCVCLYTFKVICYRFAVFGKGLYILQKEGFILRNKYLKYNLIKISYQNLKEKCYLVILIVTLTNFFSCRIM